MKNVKYSEADKNKAIATIAQLKNVISRGGHNDETKAKIFAIIKQVEQLATA